MKSQEWLRPIEIERRYGTSSRHASRDYAAARQKEHIFCGRKCKLYLEEDVKKIHEERQTKKKKSQEAWKNRPDVLRGTKSKIKKLISQKMYDKLSHAWFGMMRRCYTDERPDWHHYREFGITMCEEWLNSFDEFALWALNNGVSLELSLDRIDNEKGYSPENCRWVDKKTQGNNTSVNVRITFRGETKTISEWATETGLKYHTLYMRLQSGWSPEAAFTTPTNWRKGSNTPMLKHDGVTKPLHLWCRELNVEYWQAYRKFKKGESFANIFGDI